VPAEQLTLIAPAAPHEEGEEDAQAAREELHLPPGAQLIVSDGRPERGYGPRDAIIVFDMLRYEFKKLHLAILRPGAGAAALERLARSLAFDDYRLHFLSCMAARRTAIQRAEAMVATRPHGGLSDALEGMAGGKPVVGWRTADIAEIVEDRATGLLGSPGDHAALAVALRSLLVNPTYARRLGEAGRARAQERFSQSRMIEQFARLYSELAPHRRAEEPV